MPVAGVRETEYNGLYPTSFFLYLPIRKPLPEGISAGVEGWMRHDIRAPVWLQNQPHNLIVPRVSDSPISSGRPDVLRHVRTSA